MLWPKPGLSFLPTNKGCVESWAAISAVVLMVACLHCPHGTQQS